MNGKAFLLPTPGKLVLFAFLFFALVPVYEIGSNFPCTTSYCPRISKQASALEMAGYLSATDTYIHFAPSLLSLAGLLLSYLASCLLAFLAQKYRKQK